MTTVGACQISPASEIDTRKYQVQNILEKAQKENIDFVCFPEGFLTGYYEREDLARKNSLQVGDATFQEWLQIFNKFKTTVIVGFNEREEDKIYDSAMIVEQGRVLGIQRKHYLYHEYFSPGTSFSSYQSKGITFGVAICLDTIYFEPSRLLALQGASIIFSPMCNRVSLHHPLAKRPAYYSHFVARSYENRCWLVSADWIWHDATSICPGHSVIYDPQGQEILRSKEGQEQLLTFTIPQNCFVQEKGKRVYGSKILILEMSKILT